jgi:integrase
MIANTRKKATRLRVKGTGGIVDTGKRRDGLSLFRLRVFVGTDRTGPKPQPVVRQKTVRAKNITEAQRLYKEWEREVRASSPVTPGVRTVNDLLGEWAKRQRAQGRSARTVYDTERVRDKVLGPLIGHVDMTALTPHQIDEAWSLLGSGEAEGHAPQSPGSLRRYRSILGAAFSMAVDYDWVPSNPVPRARGIPPQNQKPLKVMTAEDVRRLLAAAEERNERYAALIRLSVLTCARLGEVCALRWSDVGADAENRPILVVGRSLYRAGRVRGEGETKTHRVRHIPVNSQLSSVLTGWRTRSEATAAEAGVKLVPDAFIVSPFPDGSRPTSPEAYSTFVSKLGKELGVKLWGRNPFRHYGATALIASGVSPADGAAILGHSRVSTFTDRYTHPTPEHSRDAAEVLGNVLCGEAEKSGEKAEAK